jgi:hypothetical protein
MPAVKVFMSYRRADNPFLAGRLKDELGRVFGEDNVFYDVDSIRAGADFRSVIRDTLETVDAVIALVGSDWDATRLAATNDPVRTELREALEKRKLLIPVLVGDTVMPAPEQLPAELETFAFLNAVRVRPDPDFENDANRLIREITHGVGAGLPPGTIPDEPPAAPPPAEPAPAPKPNGGGSGWFTGKRVALLAAGVVAAVVLVVVLLSLGGDDTVEPPPPTQVAVNGAVAWTDTGVDVATGDEVDVTATGMVFHNPQDSIGPDGVRGIAGLQGPLGSDHHAGLIGRITDAGAPFLVGEQATFVAEQDGRLYLGINDADLSTNSGAFDATVTVTPG